jgi:(p)ppGpp synthase/HD superfamily hydrolase
MRNPSVSKAIQLIRRVHGEQKDKNGKPYWRHPIRVMTRLGRSATVTERCAALLHDVVEDTATTLQDLRKEGFSSAVVRAVDLLSRSPDVTYEEYLRRIVRSGNIAAMRVKLADLLDNMSPERVVPNRREHARLLKRHRAAEQLIRSNLQLRRAKTSPAAAKITKPAKA